MSHSFNRKRSDNHNNYPCIAPVHSSGVRGYRLLLLCFVGVLLTWIFAPLALAAAPKDPFAGDTWHATDGSWPGTIRFDRKTKTVTLQPMGSQSFTAEYTFSVPSRAKGTSSKVIEGILAMKSAQGDTSQATFRINNDAPYPKLTLTFVNGRAEHYQRMTPAQEAAEIARLRKHLGR